MTDTLGFVVLAKRAGSLEPVSAVFNETNGLERAQNALEGCQSRLGRCSCWAGYRMADGTRADPACDAHEDLDGPVEYVIGELRPVGSVEEYGRDRYDDGYNDGYNQALESQD